ncbi:MAG: YlxR family protein [Dehalococcoidales bacterium]|nr:YlxR family protein [Dehalococcoidales bacterium]
MMRKTTSQNSLKHIPQRTCLACREVKDKSQLVRLVHLADGQTEIDITGKKKGRGAYLCRVKPCWETGLKKKTLLEHNLRTVLTPDNLEQLINAGKKIYLEGRDG